MYVSYLFLLRFYYMPLAYLLSDSPKTQLNILTGMHEMIFEVLMWSLEAREAVYRHLKEDPDRPGNLVPSKNYYRTRIGLKRVMCPDLTMDDVEMLPMEKVRLVWKGDRFQEGSGGEAGVGYGNAFWLHERWQSNTHLPSKARFTFACV